MELSPVEAFVRVVDAGGFSAAARALRLPKSSVSRAVSRLEEQLGVRLLERTTRTLRPTEAGRAYYESAARGLAELAEAERRVSELQGDPRGLVRVTAPVDFDNDQLASLVLRFSELHPLIHVELCFSNRLVDLVSEGFDLALRAGKLSDSSLVAKKIQSGSAAIYAAPSYLKKHGTPKRPSDLEKHACVLFRPRAGVQTWALVGPRGPEPIEVAGRLSSDDYAFVRWLAILGAGLALMPVIGSHEETRAGRLLRVLPDYEVTGGALYIVVPSTRHLPRRVALLRDFFITELQAACEGKPS